MAIADRKSPSGNKGWGFFKLPFRQSGNNSNTATSSSSSSSTIHQHQNQSNQQVERPNPHDSNSFSSVARSLLPKRRRHLISFTFPKLKTKPSTTSLAASASLSFSAPIIQIVGGHERSNSNGSIEAYEEERDWVDLDADLYDWTKPLRPVQIIRTLAPDPLKQEPLLVENVPDPLAGEQTWPTEAEMAEADQNQKQKRQKKRTLPRGTSEYQAAWIVDDSDEDDSDSDSDADEGMVLDQEDSGFPGYEGTNNSDIDEDQASLNFRYSDDGTENDSVMMVSHFARHFE